MATANKYDLHIKVPANGRINSKLVVSALDHASGKTIHSDLADLREEASRTKLAKRLAKQLDANENSLNKKLHAAWCETLDKHAEAEKKAAEQKAAKEAEAVTATTVSVDDRAKQLRAEMPKKVRKRSWKMLKDPDLLERICDDIEALGVAGERDITQLLVLSAVSRLLPKPVSVLVQGASSSGKSHVIGQTARLLPEEAVLRATDFTANALYYLPPDRLPHTWVVAGERSRKEDDDSAEKKRAFREMVSEGALRKVVTCKDESGNLTTKEIVKEGPIALVESTTKDRIFDEDANRMVSVYTNDAPEQTRRIIRQQGERAAGKKNLNPKSIIERHHAMQRRLRCCEVMIPYAAHLSDLIPDERVETRRAFPHLLSVIRASALLYQFQRDKDDVGRLLATIDDYAIARKLLANSMDRRLADDLPKPVKKFLKRLWKWKGREKDFSARKFTTSEAAARETRSRSSVWGWLGVLRDHGKIKMTAKGTGPEPYTWMLVGSKPPKFKGTVSSLPSVSVVARFEKNGPHSKYVDDENA